MEWGQKTVKSDGQPLEPALALQILGLVAEKPPHDVRFRRLEIPQFYYDNVILPDPNPFFQLSGNPALPFLSVRAQNLYLVGSHELDDQAELLQIPFSRQPYPAKLILLVFLNSSQIFRLKTKKSNHRIKSQILKICKCGTFLILIVLPSDAKPAFIAMPTHFSPTMLALPNSPSNSTSFSSDKISLP